MKVLNSAAMKTVVWVPVIGAIAAWIIHCSDEWQGGVVSKYPTVHGLYQGFVTAAAIHTLVQYVV